MKLLIYFRIQICLLIQILIVAFSVLFEFLNRFIPLAMEEDFSKYLSWITEMHKAKIIVFLAAMI